MNCEVSEIQVNNKAIKGIKIIGDKITQRNATHTIILLDVSGSMDENNKLINVKKSLNFLIKFLQSDDHLSLLTFNSMSQIIIENMNVTSDYIATFQHVINMLKADGGTNLSSGLLNVKSILQRNTSNNIKTGLIILTDGHINEGLKHSDDILRIIESIKVTLPSISITTIGYDENHNAELLKSIAVNGGGSYNIVNNNEEVATVFGEILGGLVTTVVQNCYIKYDSTWKTLNMYPKSEEGDKTIMKIGDINAESETILLFELPSTTIGNLEIGGVNTKDFSTITHNLDYTILNQNTQPYYIAYIRFEIANILQNLRSLSKETVDNRLKSIKEYLNISINILHPLTSYLKREIISIEEQLECPISMNATQNLQQSMCLAFGRGASSQRKVRRPPITRGGIARHINFEELENNMNIMATPFANAAQREISQNAVNFTQMSAANDPM